MNKKGILILTLAVLGAVAWWLNTRSSATTLDVPLSDFAIADTAGVTRIYIVDQHKKSIDLRRTANGWTLNNDLIPQQQRVDLLLRTFKRIEVRSPVAKSAEAYTLREMAAGGKKVEIYEGGDRPSKIWIVGHATKDHFGTYMLLEKPGVGRSSSPFEMNMTGFTGVLNTRFNTVLDDWRAPTVFHFADLYDLAGVQSEFPHNAKASYRIEQNEKGDVQLTTLQGVPLPMDTFLVKGALLAYQNLNYEYIDRTMKPIMRDSLLTALPHHVIKTFNRNGSEQEVKFWYMPYTGTEPTFDVSQPLYDKDRMYALVEDSLVTVVQRTTFNSILQPVQSMAR
ncbi:MAG: hypothetical protein IPI00_04045 [Flavobacteriales bacterium]|nr:hypothetical protein [Flavobacteriales bacterium]MBK7239345.1 hypothetical protein [Flavobacteriales bacterium]MBK9535450.1 hypothetical protein [Flavobacteriales bacterium]HQV51376.1 hypothetical protein [Flavobacteriales bacterium]HQX31665.1 hypothetical protein [Flavobacteriales bacterium]